MNTIRNSQSKKKKAIERKMNVEIGSGVFFPSFIEIS